MKSPEPEFNRYSDSYQKLLKDPIRDRFSARDSVFFHVRKRDLIREHFRRRRIDTTQLSYLDVGCGSGELASLLHADFARVAVCDPAAGMLEAGNLSSVGIEIQVQRDPGEIPFESASFDFMTAVCVFHHVPVHGRAPLLAEMSRVLKPGGTLAIIEHNPYNPVTRLIVSRTPVDADAILLPPAETRRLYRDRGLAIEDQRFFLYFPEPIYTRLGALESLLSKVPLGGQYALFGRAGIR